MLSRKEKRSSSIQLLYNYIEYTSTKYKNTFLSPGMKTTIIVTLSDPAPQNQEQQQKIQSESPQIVPLKKRW